MAEWDKGLTKENSLIIAMRGDKISDGQKLSGSQKRTPEWTKHHSEALKAKHMIPWNKGKTAKTDERVAKNVVNLVAINKNRPPEFCKHISENKKGKRPICCGWATGLTKETDERIMGIANNKDRSRKLSEKRIKRMQDDPEFLRMIASHMHQRPTTLEMDMMEILDKHFPNEWRYTGGNDKGKQFPAAGKLPDFVNSNDTVFIETYGGYYHDADNPQDKIDLYKRFGYKCLVFRTLELKNEQVIVDKIKEVLKNT